MQKFYSQFQRKIGNKHNCLPNSFQVSIIIMWQDECVQASPCRQHNVECYVLLLTRRAHTHILMSKFILSREHPTCRLKSRRRLLQKRTPLPAHSQEEQQDRVERRPLLELRQAEKDRQQLGRHGGKEGSLCRENIKERTNTKEKILWQLRRRRRPLLIIVMPEYRSFTEQCVDTKKNFLLDKRSCCQCAWHNLLRMYGRPESRWL